MVGKIQEGKEDTQPVAGGREPAAFSFLASHLCSGGFPRAPIHLSRVAVPLENTGIFRGWVLHFSP